MKLRKMKPESDIKIIKKYPSYFAVKKQVEVDQDGSVIVTTTDSNFITFLRSKGFT